MRTSVRLRGAVRAFSRRRSPKRRSL
jgi:hypothetical protein